MRNNARGLRRFAAKVSRATLTPPNARTVYDLRKTSEGYHM